MAGAQHILMGRHRGFETEGTNDLEIARSCTAGITVGKAEMAAGTAQLALDARYALGDLGACLVLRQLGNGEVAPGVRADRYQRIGTERPQLVPIHDEIAAERGRVVARGLGDLAHRGAQLAFRAISKRPVDLVERAIFRFRRAGIEDAQGAIENDLDPVQVNITIAATGYYYLTNRFTGSIIFERDLMSEKALAQRVDFNTRTILRMVCTPATLARIEAKA